MFFSSFTEAIVNKNDVVLVFTQNYFKVLKGV